MPAGSPGVKAIDIIVKITYIKRLIYNQIFILFLTKQIYKNLIKKQQLMIYKKDI